METRKADDHISKTFVKRAGYTERALVWRNEPDDEGVTITEEEAEILRGLDRYYDAD